MSTAAKGYVCPQCGPDPAGADAHAETHHMWPAGKRCGCCSKVRTDPNDIALFGSLTDANGKTWDICGKCIQVMWRKRAPKPDQM